MQQTKYYIEGIQAAHSGAGRFCRYHKEENREQWHAGYDSVSREYFVMRFNVDPVGMPLNSFRERPDPVYVGTLKQCQDRAVTLELSDRAAFFAVYHANGIAYKYESKIILK